MALGTAVIVGVGPGLGLELARTFGTAGHPVAMLARDKVKLDSFAKGLAATGQDARGYVTDAADPVNLRDVLNAAISEMGAPDVLVYNVGVLTPDSPSAATTRRGRTTRPSTSSAPESRPTRSCPSCATAAAPCCSPAAATRCTRPRNSPPCPSARPGCAPTWKCFTTSWRGRACTRPASRSRRPSAAHCALSRLRSPRHTSNWTISPRPSGSTSWSIRPPAPCSLLPPQTG